MFRLYTRLTSVNLTTDVVQRTGFHVTQPKFIFMQAAQETTPYGYFVCPITLLYKAKDPLGYDLLYYLCIFTDLCS